MCLTWQRLWQTTAMLSAALANREGMKMKELFEKPEMEIIRFQTEDVITASNGGDLDDLETPIDNPFNP